MYDEEPPARRFYAVSHDEDSATIARGTLIPAGLFVYMPSRAAGAVAEELPDGQLLSTVRVYRVAIMVMSFFLVATLSFAATRLLQSYQPSLTAMLSKTEAPLVVLEDPLTKEQTPLNYGVNVTFTEPSFFAETRDTFIEAEKSFIEADLTTMELRVFKNGVLEKQVPILSKGKKGSWWETPAGLYEIEFKKENHFSSFGQVYQPWSMAFQGNFFIHGWPYYPGGEPVPEGFSGGCIRLSTEDAEIIYGLVDTGMPVLVHEIEETADDFLYEPKIPELDTPHYLIADVESSTVLASSDLDDPAPIASLTKLMTALIAAEYINLDKNVQIHQSSFVTSLIPRLGDRSTVSMYSLLQLLLVESSNEAADVIANQIGREQFIAHMNDKAAALGLTNTHFADPSGLSADNVSTIRDLLRLVQYIYNNRRFVIELTANQDLPTAYTSGQFGELVNFNEVDGLENFIGGKVGETLAAGQTSITLHTLMVKGERRVLAIVLLGSDSRNDDVRELLRYAEERFGY